VKFLRVLSNAFIFVYATAKVGNKSAARVVVDTLTIIYSNIIVAVMAALPENASLMNLSNSE
jgi:hypothetical protein